jgi:hypothetical protein
MKRLFIIYCLILTTQYAHPCQCLEVVPTCCASLHYDPVIIESIGYPILATCVKLDNYYHGAHFKVLEVLGGELEKDTVLIWGTDGTDCRIYVSQFGIGDTIVFLMFAFTHTPPAQTLEQAGDFTASICRISDLPVINDTVWGPVDVGVYNLPYQAFKDYISDCYPYDDVSVLSASAHSLSIRLMQPNYQIPISLPINPYSLPTAPIYFDLIDLNGRSINRQVLTIGADIAVDIPPLKGLFLYQISSTNGKLASGKVVF